MLTEFFLQTIKPWLFPPRIYFVMLILASLLVLSGRKRIAKNLAIFIAIIIWTFSTPDFAQFLMNSLQKSFPPLTLSQLNNGLKSDAIIVLAHGVATAQEYPQKDIPAPITLSRLNYGIYLSKITHAPLILSGGRRAATGLTEAGVMKMALDPTLSTPLLESKSQNTQQQGACLKNILQQNNIHSVMIVTNAWHMARTVYAFNKSYAGANITIIPAPMGYITLKSESLFINLLPSLEAFTATVGALHEYFGIAELHLFWNGKLKSTQC